MLTSDIDGTLLDYNYIPGQLPAVNWPLLRQLAERSDSLTLGTNQGGLPWGVAGAIRKDGRPYPRPADFVGRLFTLVGAATMVGIRVRGVFVSVYHPTAPEDAVMRAAHDVDALLHQMFGPAAFVYAGATSRKPSPTMLSLAKASVYYGDSDEDAAAASAAGVEFVRVERFMGSTGGAS